MLVFREGLHATCRNVGEPAVERRQRLGIERRSILVGGMAEILQPEAREFSLFRPPEVGGEISLGMRNVNEPERGPRRPPVQRY